MDPIEAFAQAAETEWLGVLKPQTADTYRFNLSHWLSFCRREGIDPSDPPRLAPKTFIESLRSTQGLPYAPLTVRRMIAALSSAYSAILPDRPRNPFGKRALRRPDADYEPTKIVSSEDVERLVAAASERGETPLRDVAILQVLWCTGMRRASIATIRREVDRRDGVMSVFHRIKGRDKPDSTELSEEAARAVDAWLAVAPPSRWLFCKLDSRPMGGQRTGRRRAPETRDRHPALSPSAVTKIVARASQAAGIHVHPHQFRAAVATDALDRGIPVERVRAFLRQKDVRTTLRYDRGQRGGGVAAELAAARRAGKP